MEWRTVFDHVDVFSDPGDSVYTEYTEDENGFPVVTGENDLYVEIQSHRESVELSTLLQRYASGDVDALNRVQGAYADVADFPTSLAEMHDIVKQTESEFNALPDSFRREFGYDVRKYLQSFGTPEYIQAVERYVSSMSENNSSSSSSGNRDPESSGGDN